ncbi:MAG: NupC/NupG family nucleoside CNT transporter [Bacteriovoracaceae bacterium]|nr:NupC/NupG family nucleoside CNT transporter [Bacteriovoracaceae bacterium]
MEDLGLRLTSLVGLFAMVGFAFLLSNNKKKINWRTVVTGIALQIIFGLIIMKTAPGKAVFDGARVLFAGILSYTNEGSSFVFGSLADGSKSGFVFATMTLPTIIFMSALMSVLYHIGVMQWIIKGVAWAMMKTMRTSGAESLSCAANIFVGQTEAPLVVKPYISKMTMSELMATMTGGMATVAGGVLAAYVGFGVDAGHLLSASVMAAPAALVLAKLMVPETEESTTAGSVKMEFEKTSSNIVEAAAGGAAEGLQLALNVAGMLIGFIALIAMLNGLIGFIGGLFGLDALSLELMFGYLFAPVAFIIGVPWADCTMFGELIGKKVVINEFVAYLDLKTMMSGEKLGAGGHQLSERATVMATYALCGFANFSSIAIQLGGIGGIAPERRGDLAKLGFKALIGGTMAGLMTASVAGMFI